MHDTIAKGFREELDFWDSELSLTGDYAEGIRNRLDPERMHLNFPTEILPYIEALKERFRETPRVIDVGSGPLSMLAMGCRQGLYHLTNVDPSAGEYMKLLAKHGHEPPWPLAEAFGEDLKDRFAPESFHLVWSHNALDHCQNPGLVLDNFSTVLKPEGLAIIQARESEGSAMEWNGLHQHDLKLSEAGELLHRTSSGDAEFKSLLNRSRWEIVKSHTESRGGRNYFRVVIRKASCPVP